MASPIRLISADSLDVDRVALVSGVTAGAFTVGHGMLNTLWWKGERAPFHINIEQDWTYSLGADKFGHALFPYVTTHIYKHAFGWCGMDSIQRVWWAAGLAMTYQTYIEVRDGFSKQYGFSPGDMMANLIGSALPVIQAYEPTARAFTLQISFRPSEAFHRGDYNAIIDDYTSTQHWIAFNPSMLVRTSWLPDWLGIAVGHTVESLDGNGGGNHVFLIGLDWHLSRIPGLPLWLKDVLDVVHIYHLPAPTLRFAPGRVTGTF